MHPVSTDERNKKRTKMKMGEGARDFISGCLGALLSQFFQMLSNAEALPTLLSERFSVFRDRVSLCSLSSCLPSAGIKGVRHHSPAVQEFFN